jgi:hypothetical protein
MAVFWKNVHILVNGLDREYERNGSNISIPLTEEQLADDIYITVYATDLARNEAQETAVFEAPTTGIVPLAETVSCKLYPNPSTDICYLFVPNALRQNAALKYAVVSPLGQVFVKDLIRAEETMIPVGKLATGIYFVIVYDENKIITNQKLIKK